MTQHSSKQTVFPARGMMTVGPVLENAHKLASDHSCSLPSSAGLLYHKIRKRIKKNSVEYFCPDCNIHYARKPWVLEDHPGYDVKNFTIVNLKGEFY